MSDGKSPRFSSQGLTLRDTWAPLVLIAVGTAVVVLAIVKQILQ